MNNPCSTVDAATDERIKIGLLSTTVFSYFNLLTYRRAEKSYVLMDIRTHEKLRRRIACDGSAHNEPVLNAREQ